MILSSVGFWQDLRAAGAYHDRAESPAKLPRAKSMQQQGRPVKPVINRPNSTRAAAEIQPVDAKKKKGKVVPKVAFGNPIQATEKKVPPIARAGAAVVANRGRNDDEISRDNRSNGRQLQPPPRSRSPDAGGRQTKVGFANHNRGRDDGPAVSGFAKLALAAKASPVVVTYEDEPVGGLKGKRRTGASSSLELNGESEYLRIGRAGEDVIGGDQLDRLLVQARRARAGP